MQKKDSIIDMAVQARPKIERIGIDEVKRRMKNLVFVDARSATALSRNPTRVPNAFHAPIKNLEEAAKNLPRNRAIVTYCT
jgi:rhodanese-related sulfurtransferase